MSGTKKLLAAGITISIIFVVIGCVWLSYSIETLDKVAEHFGSSESPIWTPLFPDYEIPGLEGSLAANIFIGIVFTLLTLGVAFAAGKALKAKK
ncbi:MAG: hypothetical protein ACUVQY_07050 [Thermoproteota archaeon]